MVNILIARQAGVSDRLPAIAAAVAAGARTVRESDVRLCSLGAVDIDRLRWCDGLVIGVHSDLRHGPPGLEEWRRRLEPHFWNAVQGKFASVFVATPEEVGKRMRAHDFAVQLLTAHGMLVTEFASTAENSHASVASRFSHFHHEYERLGRLSAGMVHAWIGRAGNPRRRRIIGSLVRATRRVSAMRPGDAATDSASGRYPLSGMPDDMVPGY